ncbi:Hypothetical_protein [Hexamita inflata]|uniref:Hypothetical_protein n=1 Tax=Hexamita inflata TaxID=28002 RepID=A0AA86PAA4_9EUKA|nr:Hypothetical protein HINF_LOCUS22701 [Hexamita inflata]
MMQGHLNSDLALQSLNIQQSNYVQFLALGSQLKFSNLRSYKLLVLKYKIIQTTTCMEFAATYWYQVSQQTMNILAYFDGQTCVCKQELQYHNSCIDTLGQMNLNMLTNITSTTTYAQNMYDSQLTTLNTNISGTSTQFLQRYGLQLQKLTSNVTAVDWQVANNNAAIIQHEASNITKMQNIQRDNIDIANNAADQNYTYIRNYFVGKTNALNQQKQALNVSINNNVVSNFTMLTTNLMNQVSQITQKTAMEYSCRVQLFVSVVIQVLYWFLECCLIFWLQDRVRFGCAISIDFPIWFKRFLIICQGQLRLVFQKMCNKVILCLLIAQPPHAVRVDCSLEFHVCEVANKSLLIINVVQFIVHCAL